MKIKISVLWICLFTAMVVGAQDPDITGDWTMYEMTWSTGDDVNTTTEDQLKDQGMFSDYFIMPDGNIKLVSNMTGSGNLETMEGTWKLEGDKLTYSLNLGGTMRDIVWDFEFRDDAIHLTRTSPDGATSVVNSFKRK
jgi:hypothetical protein